MTTTVHVVIIMDILIIKTSANIKGRKSVLECVEKRACIAFAVRPKILLYG